MAKPVVIKSSKTTATASAPTPPAAPPAAPTAESAVASVLAAPTNEAAPAPQPAAKPAAVKVRESSRDILQVTVFETIDPAPIIGSWKGSDELGVTKLEPKKTYRVPRFVAEVLVDANKAAILEG